MQPLLRLVPVYPNEPALFNVFQINFAHPQLCLQVLHDRFSPFPSGYNHALRADEKGQTEAHRVLVYRCALMGVPPQND